MKKSEDKMWEKIAMALSNEELSGADKQLMEDWQKEEEDTRKLFDIMSGISLNPGQEALKCKDEVLNLTYSKMFTSDQNNHKKKRFLFMSVAASVLVLLSIGGYFLMNTSKEEKLISVYCALGEISKKIILPDSTEVILNSDSRLVYNENLLVNNYRKVSLEGEAFFTVTHDKNHPFIVNVNGAAIKVLGTSFNVRSYSNEDQVQTTLINGSVEVENTKTIGTVRIKPNEQAILSRVKGNLEVVQVNVDDFIMWKEGWMQFQALPFRDVTLLLERRFNVKITIQNNSLKDVLFTGRFEQDEKLEDIIKVIQIYGKFNYQINNNEYIIY